MPEFVLPLDSIDSHEWFDGLPDIARGYIEAAFFCGVSVVVPDPDGETELADGARGRCEELDGVGPANLDAESRAGLEAQAVRFWIANAATVAEVTTGGAYDLEQAGRDFWFTRNGHGVGFWCRDIGDAGDALTEACDWRGDFGEVDLYAEPVDGESVDLEALEAGAWRVMLDRAVSPLTDAERATLAALEAGATGGAPVEALSEVGGRYGAPMGRRSDVLDAAEPVTVRRVTLDAGGYDSGGAYWGTGTPLWRAVAADGAAAYVRADTRADAIAQINQGEAA
ncbi:hypothetical protein [Shimia sp.]|uniref:hypothetical protein n=1 Tax=Shimia sp. TaxID=1954381 RepID=UPI00329926C1